MSMASSKPVLFTIVATVALSLVPLQSGGQDRVALLAFNAEMFFPAPVGHGPANGHASSQGYLGIMVRDVTDAEVSTLHLKSPHGAEVTKVDHDGPAGKAGLRAHDVILSVNGTSVDDEDSLHRLLHDLQPGRAVTLNVCRDGSEQTVSATMANRTELEKQSWEQHWVVPEPATEDTAASAPAPSHSSFGFMTGHLLPLTPAYTGAKVDAMGTQLAGYFGVKDGKGLLVHEVEANSPAAIAGLQAGDVVTRVNGGHVATKSDWTRSLRDSKGHPVSLTVVRDRHEQTLTMVPDAKHRSAVDPPPTTDEDRNLMSMLLE
jgi:serine protease Do